MSTIEHMPMGAASDDMLMERLFELALHDDVDQNELEAIDAAVYARLEQAYGHEDTPRQRSRMAA